MKNDLTYIFHGCFPDPRAAAIFAVEEVKSLAEYFSVTLIIPRRYYTNIEKAKSVYNLPDNVKIVVLPVIELNRFPLLRFFSFQFSIVSFSFQLLKYLRGSPRSWVITVDHLPALIASLCGKKVLIEIHDFPTSWNPIWRLLLRRADKILSTNEWKARELNRKFKTPQDRIFVEKNGIDLKKFAPRDKNESREILKLPIDSTIVLYAGNLYSWKGVDTLIHAAKFIPNTDVYIVGGTSEEQERMKNYASNNVYFIPRVPHNESPLWQSAADILVLPNTAREEISAHFTSPIKLFEHMALGRPIVASNLPSIHEILPDDAGFFFEPDNPKDLADAIKFVIENPYDAALRADNARRAVVPYAWSSRAERIIRRINS